LALLGGRHVQLEKVASQRTRWRSGVSKDYPQTAKFLRCIHTKDARQASSFAGMQWPLRVDSSHPLDCDQTVDLNQKRPMYGPIGHYAEAVLVFPDLICTSANRV